MMINCPECDRTVRVYLNRCEECLDEDVDRLTQTPEGLLCCDDCLKEFFEAEDEDPFEVYLEQREDAKRWEDDDYG